MDRLEAGGGGGGSGVEGRGGLGEAGGDVGGSFDVEPGVVRRRRGGRGGAGDQALWPAAA